MKNKEIEKHKLAAKKLELIMARAFEFIKRSLCRVSEYDVGNFILSEFEKENLVTDKKNPIQIVATDENTAIVHYFPQKKNAKIIKKNSLILIDIWARLNKERAPFADITWMSYSGKNIPKEIRETFIKVIKARNFGLCFIKNCLKNRQFPKTRDVEIAMRNYFKKFGLEKFFLHRAGHSLGFSVCHGKYFRFDKKSKARIKPNIPFTIEPGLYFKNRPRTFRPLANRSKNSVKDWDTRKLRKVRGKFGIRSEINCYVNEDYKLITTTEIQKEIVKI